MTAHDVAWTFNTLMEKGRPSIRVQYADVESATAESDRRVVFRFKTDTNRELPLAVGGVPVMSRAWWSTRDFTRPLTEPPLGSGPYKVERFELGRTVSYVRDPNWWARDRPTGRGFHNFDRVRIEYFRDQTVAFQSFKAGQADYRQENVSKEWVTGLRLPRPARRLRSIAGAASQAAHRHPGLRDFEHPARHRVQGPPRARGAWPRCTTSSGSTRTCSLAPTLRSQQLFRQHGAAIHRPAGCGGAGVAGPVQATALPARPVHRAVHIGRQPTASGTNRDGQRRALALFREAGWTVKDRKLVDAVRQADGLHHPAV